MPKEFPRALYTGNQTNYEMIVVENVEEERELREQGAVDFADLPEREIGVELGSTSEVNPDSFITQERFELATQELVEVKQELVTANTEIKRLNQVITDGMAENTELRKQIRLKELEDISADELKKLLDDAEVTYQASDRKPVLAKLLLDHETANPN
ncbi:hypothetical protein [Acinetobacter sp. ANC 4173]|uniref:hypothetical protein n=1 Tax=Acinetobacter sp. ANC 4173 TaxID=2529837 RepID=UPI00103ABD65|nr:hypothetical protein [Acinetobacter sp. ANC 4173]TCB77442.1 hypothetical protein E0H94_14715 [Acinetobacter sp. ANC 4173]